MALPVAGFLMSMVGPIVKRVLLALGVGVISYAAVMTAFNAAKDQLLSTYGSISADIVWFVDLVGAFDSMSIILGAMAARLVLQSAAKFGKLAT